MDNGNLLEEFDRRRRWPMLARRARSRHPGGVHTLLRRASPPRTDHAVARAAAGPRRPDPGHAGRAHAARLVAWTSFAFRQVGEAFDHRRRAGARRRSGALPETHRQRYGGHVALVEAAGLRDLLEFDVAALRPRRRSRGSISARRGPFDQAVAMAAWGCA